MKILVGFTGSVATVLAHKVVAAFAALGEVRVILTQYAELSFTDSEALLRAGATHIYRDRDEWTWQHKIGGNEFSGIMETNRWDKTDPVLHIVLREWADVFIIAPIDAHTLGKMANGLADNLLATVIRAWDFNKPMVLAPAMNTVMWEHPITAKQLREVQTWGTVAVVEPQTKMLACGTYGKGAMADIKDIVESFYQATKWGWPFPYGGCYWGLPVGNHPGAFGYRRKHDVHTGVDLYTVPDYPVMAVEDGTVVRIIPFTGKEVKDKAGHPMDWWLDTDAILVQGRTGVICYGEVAPAAELKVGDKVTVGQQIANVKQVLPDSKVRKDIPGHSTAMLHIELYTALYDDLDRGVWEGWELDKDKPAKLLDPTPYLLRATPHDCKILKMK